jgi:hypothetical protein
MAVVYLERPQDLLRDAANNGHADTSPGRYATCPRWPSDFRDRDRHRTGPRTFVRAVAGRLQLLSCTQNPLESEADADESVLQIRTALYADPVEAPRSAVLVLDHLERSFWSNVNSPSVGRR